jgi:hypothetical protein
MKVDSADIVQMAVQCEQTATGFVIPHLDLIVIATRYEEGLRRMKSDTSNRAYLRRDATRVKWACL